MTAKIRTGPVAPTDKETAETSPLSTSEGTTEAGKGDADEKESQVQILLRIVESAGVELFHTPDRAAYALVPADDHLEVWPVRSKDFRDWLLEGYYRETGTAPSSQNRQAAINTLEARARFSGKEHPVFTRVAPVDSSIYLDLCNDKWEAVQVTAQGWTVVKRPPVRFRRTQAMRPLPRPVAGGSLDDLRRLVNLPDDSMFILFVAFLVAALGRRGPFPVLVLQGEQGSSKSTLARLVSFLVDPSAAPLRTAPMSERDLMIAATRCHLLVFDNLSGIRPWFSDALCRLSTGGGFSTRELFTDADEIVFSAMRPVVLNGIDEVLGRQDLADRSLVLRLPAISDDKRRSERDLWAEAEALRPKILGALLDAVSCALRNYDRVTLPSSPRMADFTHWVVAAEPALPWPEGAFLEAYEANRGELIAASFEVNEFARAVVELVDFYGDFEGTCKELLDTLKGAAAEGYISDATWPANPKALRSQLARDATLLRQYGVKFTKLPRQGNRRAFLLTRTKAVPDRHDRHNRHDRHKDPVSEGSASDGRADTVTVQGADRHAAKRPPARAGDGCDGCDGSAVLSPVGPPLDDDEEPLRL